MTADVPEAATVRPLALFDVLVNEKPTRMAVITPHEWEQVPEDQRPPCAIDATTRLRLIWWPEKSTT